MSKKLIPDAKSIDFQTDDISQLSDVERGVALELARERVETRHQGGMRAYLVGVESPETDPLEMKESLGELAALIRSLEDEPIGVTVQKRRSIVPATYIGSGKAEEIRSRCQELKVDYVAFDVELTPTHVRNLEQIISRPVLDRTEVILHIFRKNAKTKEAQTQVEIARLEYLLPRISNSWIAFERQRGGSGGSARVRGAGEAQLELDRRRMRDKISALKKDLEKITTEKLTQRKSRRDEFNVVLVGYTNAGKTTLMNALTDSKLSARNALFETLDSSVRTLKGVSQPKILLTDTVGFIRRLPHSLVASFRSTLEETADADLLLHVVDISHRNYKDHIEVTREVLREVGAGDVPTLMVFNKSDALEGEPRLTRILSKSYPGSIALSATLPEDIDRLQEAIRHYFVRNMVRVELKVPYDHAQLMGLIYAHTRVSDVTWEDDIATFRVHAPHDFLAKYFPEALKENAGFQNPEKDQMAMTQANGEKVGSTPTQKSPSERPQDPWQIPAFGQQRRKE